MRTAGFSAPPRNTDGDERWIGGTETKQTVERLHPNSPESDPDTGWQTAGNHLQLAAALPLKDQLARLTMFKRLVGLKVVFYTETCTKIRRQDLRNDRTGTPRSSLSFRRHNKKNKV